MMSRLAALVAVLVLVVLVAIGWEFYRPYRGYSGSQTLVIEPGLRAPAVAGLLVEHGVLAYRWPFLFLYSVGRRRHTLKAGEYLFDQPLTPLDVYRKLARGEVHLLSVAIPEGSDRFDIARILNQQLGMNAEEFLRVTEQAGLLGDLDPKAPALEGYLFPDTYRFPRGVSPAHAAATMLERFRQVLDTKLAEELRQSPRRLHDTMILASLIEKETSDPAERPLISGVFVRRLEKGRALECDPTVMYAARLNHRLLDPAAAPITQSDLKFDSPYNTYRHAGLPPGPICNPGEASILAALKPAGGDYFYFVSNNHGGHVFARTLAEHQHNVARYRREVAVFRRGTPAVKRRTE